MSKLTSKGSDNPDSDIEGRNGQFFQTIDRYEEYLLSQGVGADEAARHATLLATFAAKELPDLSVLAAVRELRDQAHAKEPDLPQYPGLRSGIDPMEFALEHLGEAIRSGGLTAGQLAVRDSKLYDGIRDRLSLRTPPMTVSEFFESLKPEHKKGRAMDRRVRAVATVLDTSERAAGLFFYSVSAHLRQSAVGRAKT